MANLLTFSKDLIQLVLAPRRGWLDIEKEDPDPQKLTETGFYPLLSIVALTAFCHGLYGSEKFDVARQLIEALCQFLSLFMGAMLARVLFESMLARVCGATASEARMNLVIIYCLSLMGLIDIISNLCPIELAVIWFLPAFVALVAWQARTFLGVNTFKQGQYIAFALLCLIILPVVIGFLLHLIVTSV